MVNLFDLIVVTAAGSVDPMFRVSAAPAKLISVARVFKRLKVWVPAIRLVSTVGDTLVKNVLSSTTQVSVLVFFRYPTV